MKCRIFLLGAILFLAGCQPTLQDHFKQDTCDQKKWTDEQCRAAFTRGTRLLFGKENPDKKGEYEVNYGVLNISDVDREIKNLRADIGTALDYNNKGDSKFIDVHNLRPHLEHQEKVLEALDSALQTVSLYSEFQRQTGLSVDYSSYGYNGNSHVDSYDLKKIFGAKDLSLAYPFTSDQIENARKQGKLEEIESIDFKFNRVLDHKIPDPSDPGDPKDENRFIWRPHSERLSATNYKIWDTKSDPKPENSLGNYIEVYRMSENGNKESSPALKIFSPQGNGQGVLVLDSDREGKDPGFGLPDSVETVYISGLRDIIQNQTLLGRIFQEKEKQERIKPQTKPVFAEIARAGQPAMDMWEKSPDASGWKLNLKYQNPLKNNYNVHLKLMRDAKNTNGGQPPDIVTTIEYISKEWTGGDRFTPSIGAVIEFFNPKPPYDKENIAKASVRESENTKMLNFEFTDGTLESGIVSSGTNKYIEDEPYAVEYTEGSTRWRIEKDQGSSVFNKRKQVAFPKTSTGVY